MKNVFNGLYWNQQKLMKLNEITIQLSNSKHWLLFTLQYNQETNVKFVQRPKFWNYLFFYMLVSASVG